MVDVLAFIGLVALAIGVYLFVKRFLVDREYERAEAIARLIDFDINGAQNPFTEEYQLDDLYKPVFRLLPETSNETANKFNRLIEKIGKIARCYYYLLENVYENNRPKSATKSKDRFRLLIFETEIIRESIWDSILPGKKKFSPDKDPFSERETNQLAYAYKEISKRLVEISEIYKNAREACINSVGLSKLARMDRIYRIKYTERKLFENDEEVLRNLEESSDTALKNLFSEPEKGPVAEVIAEMRSAIEVPAPPTTDDTPD